MEVYYILGLTEEAKKYAQLLGYNHNSSEWYEKSYALFDKNYKGSEIKMQKKDKKSNIVIRKFKSLFEWDEKKRNY